MIQFNSGHISTRSGFSITSILHSQNYQITFGVIKEILIDCFTELGSSTALNVDGFKTLTDQIGNFFSVNPFELYFFRAIEC